MVRGRGGEGAPARPPTWQAGQAPGPSPQMGALGPQDHIAGLRRGARGSAKAPGSGERPAWRPRRAPTTQGGPPGGAQPEGFCPRGAFRALLIQHPFLEQETEGLGGTHLPKATQ